MFLHLGICCGLKLVVSHCGTLYLIEINMEELEFPKLLIIIIIIKISLNENLGKPNFLCISEYHFD